jgi:hypothetical protein
MIVGICPTFYWTLMLVTCCGLAFACLRYENMRNLLVFTVLFSVSSSVYLPVSLVILARLSTVYFVLTILSQIINTAFSPSMARLIINNILPSHHLLLAYQQYTVLYSPSVALLLVLPGRNYSSIGRQQSNRPECKPDQRVPK